PGEKKLCSAAQDHNIVRCSNFGDCRTHHFVVDAAIFLDSRKLLGPNRELLIDNDIHCTPIDELEVQSLRSQAGDFAPAAAGQTGNRDDSHNSLNAIVRSLCITSGSTSGSRRSKPVSLTKATTCWKRARRRRS